MQSEIYIVDIYIDSSRCGKCAPGRKDLTLNEERELAHIEKNLVYVGDHFEVKYPWLRDPKLLLDNYGIARKQLETLEKRLSKNDNAGKEYNDQIQDMLDRKVAREMKS